MHVIITGGGTGGHAFPALEIAKEFRDRDADARITYVGNTGSLEEKLARKNNFAFFALSTHKIVGQSTGHKFIALLYLAVAVLKSCWFLLKNRPRAVIGVGGYVSAPMLIASFILRIKRYICEQNVVPGLANKMLAKIAHRIFISFAASVVYFPASKTLLTGNPVRKAFFDLEPKNYSHNNSLSILVSGGSMGASFINTYVPQSIILLKQYCPSIRVTHQCGEKMVTQVATNYLNATIRADVFSFIEDMPEAFSNHDVIISRAGATVVAEIMASGMPAIFVPYRFAHGHQKANAMALAERHAGIMLLECENFSYELAQIIRNLYENKSKLAALSLQAKIMGMPDAAAVIVTTVLKECQ